MRLRPINMRTRWYVHCHCVMYRSSSMMMLVTINLSIPSIYISIYPINLPHLPIHYPSTYPSTYLPTYPSTYLPTYPSTYPSTYLPTYPSTYLPTYLPTHLPTYLPTYLPIHLSTYPSHLIVLVELDIARDDAAQRALPGIFAGGWIAGSQ